MPASQRKKAAVLSAVSLVAALATGCTGAAEEQPQGVGTPAPTLIPVQEYDLSASELRRADPCPLLTKAAATALAGKPTESRWAPGDSLPGHKGAVSHEWGCEFSRGGASVAAWVAVPPVTKPQARAWLKATARGCKKLPNAPGFGQPGAAWSCANSSASAAPRSARMVGLLGDSWVGCTATGADEASAVELTSRWCGAVLQAAAAS